VRINFARAAIAGVVGTIAFDETGFAFAGEARDIRHWAYGTALATVYPVGALKALGDGAALEPRRLASVEAQAT